MNSETIEFDHFSLHQIREFTTKVWEHPLIDQQTREHRLKAKNNLANVLNSMGFSNEDYITIPIGSLSWSVDQQSDFDYLLIFKNKALTEKANPLLTEEILDSNHIEIHGLASDIETIRITGNLQIYADLLLTPDDYIGGNTSLAQNIRLSAIQEFSKPERKDAWDWEVRRQYEGAYKYWESLHPEHTTTDKGLKTGERDRKARIEMNLRLRANQTRDPENYIKIFKKARESMNLPSFSAYKQGLIESKGRLSLLPHFAATGII